MLKSSVCGKTIPGRRRNGRQVIDGCSLFDRGISLLCQETQSACGVCEMTAASKLASSLPTSGPGFCTDAVRCHKTDPFHSVNFRLLLFTQCAIWISPSHNTSRRSIRAITVPSLRNLKNRSQQRTQCSKCTIPVN